MALDHAILRLIPAWNGYGMLLFVLITSLTAAVLSFAVGVERVLRGKNISMTTYVLLSIGCSLLMTVSVWAIRLADGAADGLTYDTSRIAAGVITGMGFLGAGAIIKERLSVKGLSTAATFWICSAIGLACGSGFLVEAVVFTAVVLIVMSLIGGFNRILDRRAPRLKVTADNAFPLIPTINQLASQHSTLLKSVRIDAVTETQTVALVVFPVRCPETMVDYFRNQLNHVDGLTAE